MAITKQTVENHRQHIPITGDNKYFTMEIHRKKVRQVDFYKKKKTGKDN